MRDEIDQRAVQFSRNWGGNDSPEALAAFARSEIARIRDGAQCRQLPDRAAITAAIEKINENERPKFIQWEDGSYRTYFAGFDLTRFAERMLSALNTTKGSDDGH
jgi:hypothetical protein